MRFEFADVTCETDGHDMISIGGRPCPKGFGDCSQTVYECRRCGAADYGEKGGKAHEECFSDCQLKDASYYDDV